VSEISTDYRGLLDALFAKAAMVGQPINGLFEVTSRCNLRCQMCYITEPSNAQEVRAHELSTQQWLSLARQATDAGMLFVCLTGGEPLLRSDFFNIYEPLTTWGLNITLFTNATLITPTIAHLLAQAPPNRLEVSLYGATEEVYERVTGVSGSYTRCLRGIDALLETGKVPLLIKTTLSRLNVHELSAMRDLTHRLGVPFQAAWLLTPRRDRTPGCAETIRLSAEDVVLLEQNENVAVSLEELSTADGDHGTFYCNAGRSNFMISADGEMNACVDLPVPRVRPLDVGFATAWEATQHVVAAIEPSPVCSICNNEYLCPRCPAYAYLETGSTDEPVPYLCGIAKERRIAAQRSPQ
jgi:radical SAM protein with 4Fe4S-binding SPASM domain